MVKAKLKDIKSQVQRETEEVYGEESAVGSSPSPESDDDASEPLEKMVGKKIRRGDPFDLEKEVEQDEKDRRTKPKIVLEE